MYNLQLLLDEIGTLKRRYDLLGLSLVSTKQLLYEEFIIGTAVMRMENEYKQEYELSDLFKALDLAIEYHIELRGLT